MTSVCCVLCVVAAVADVAVANDSGVDEAVAAEHELETQVN